MSKLRMLLTAGFVLQVFGCATVDFDIRFSLGRFEDDLESLKRDGQLAGWNYDISGQSMRHQGEPISGFFDSSTTNKSAQIHILLELPASLTDEQCNKVVSSVNESKSRNLGPIELRIASYLLLEYKITQLAANQNDLNREIVKIESEILKLDKDILYEYVFSSDLARGVKRSVRYAFRIPWPAQNSRTTATMVDNWFQTSAIISKYELKKVF